MKYTFNPSTLLVKPNGEICLSEQAKNWLKLSFDKEFKNKKNITIFELNVPFPEDFKSSELFLDWEILNPLLEKIKGTLILNFPKKDVVTSLNNFDYETRFSNLKKIVLDGQNLKLTHTSLIGQNGIEEVNINNAKFIGHDSFIYNNKLKKVELNNPAKYKELVFLTQRNPKTIMDLSNYDTLIIQLPLWSEGPNAFLSEKELNINPIFNDHTIPDSEQQRLYSQICDSPTMIINTNSKFKIYFPQLQLTDISLKSIENMKKVHSCLKNIYNKPFYELLNLPKDKKVKIKLADLWKVVESKAKVSKSNPNIEAINFFKKSIKNKVKIAAPAPINKF